MSIVLIPMADEAVDSGVAIKTPAPDKGSDFDTSRIIGKSGLDWNGPIASEEPVGANEVIHPAVAPEEPETASVDQPQKLHKMPPRSNAASLSETSSQSGISKIPPERALDKVRGAISRLVGSAGNKAA